MSREPESGTVIPITARKNAPEDTSWVDLAGGDQ